MRLFRQEGRRINEKKKKQKKAKINRNSKYQATEAKCKSQLLIDQLSIGL